MLSTRNCLDGHGLVSVKMWKRISCGSVVVLLAPQVAAVFSVPV